MKTRTTCLILIVFFLLTGLHHGFSQQTDSIVYNGGFVKALINLKMRTHSFALRMIWMY